ADELYERIMNADGFDEATGYEILGQIYPEYDVLNRAEQVYEQALRSDNPQEIARLGSQLAQQQQRPLRQLQGLILHLRSLPPSDTLNRALATLLLERNYQLPATAESYGELFQLLGAPDSTHLAEPLDWRDPALALEALFYRYRSPVDPQGTDAELLARLEGLEHCLALLHHFRRTRKNATERRQLAATLPPLAHRALVIALALDQRHPQQAWREQAFLIAEQAKATLLADRLQGYVADRTQTQWPPLSKQLRLARQLQQQQANTFAEPQRLRAVVDRYLGELGAWPPLPDPEVSVTAIQQRLATQQALLISYFRIGDQGVVFSLDGEQLQVEHFYWNRETQTALRDLRREMEEQNFLRQPTESFQRFAKASFWLYENTLLRPALRHGDGTARELILLPDAELWDIPFGALLRRAADQQSPSYHPNDLDYLIEDYALSVAPSVTSWWELQQRAAPPLRVAAVAPDFSGPSVASRQLCSGSLTALPNSSREAAAVLNTSPGQAFIGPDADWQNLQNETDPFSVWHLATHACRQQNPDESAIFFQQGALTAKEISALPLSLQLVVLSACETQSGPYQAGVGVLSIGRAFLQAGSRSLIGSLWPVNDAATAELLPPFYHYLTTGERTAQALRSAQLQYLQQQDRLSAHPHYWAGFLLVGPSQAFAQPDNYWYWLGGLGLLGLAGWMAVRKQL
ncbi:MAG: CHAT domain-containing protein, partial [Bacteroidota bacterium]